MVLQQRSPTTTRSAADLSAPDDRQLAAAAHAHQIEERWHRFIEIAEPSLFADLMGDADVADVNDVQETAGSSTRGWRKGVDADRRVGPALEAGFADIATVLHARKASRSRADIDHLIVAASGVWIVNTKSNHGRVERRDVGTWRTADLRLYIDGRDQTKLLEQFSAQKQAVRAALDPTGIVGVPIHSVLMFTDADPKGSNAPIAIRGVRAVWAKRLIELVSGTGPLDEAAREIIVNQLGATLKARRGTRRTDR